MGETFTDILEELGFTEGFISVCWQSPDDGTGKRGPFNSAVVPIEEAQQSAELHAETSDVWFGVNPVRGPARFMNGRGTTADITRLQVLFVDLDVKPEGMPSFEACWDVISELSAMLNCAPVAVTHSGNGLQPLWAVEDGQITDGGGDFPHVAARSLLRRWGRLAAVVAESHGGAVDSVYDLPRVLRVPGTFNRKEEPKPVISEFKGGYAVELSQIRDTLREYNIVEIAQQDGDEFGPALTAPSEWHFGPTTWPYIKRMMATQIEDEPDRGRHSWLMKVFVRLASAWRTGRISRDDFRTAQASIVARLEYLCETGNPKRSVNPGEIQGAWQWALGKVCSMPNDRVFDEVGGTNAKPPAGDLASASVPPIVAEREDGNVFPSLVPGNPKRFFFDKKDDEGEGLKAHDLARAVLDLGPLRWGGDESYWTWSPSGVWKPAYKEVEFRCVRLLGNLYRNSHAGNVDTVIRSMAEKLSCGPVEGYLNFSNGMLNWRTGEMVPHDPAFGSTIQFPLAYTTESECPVFDNFLADILEPDYVALAWQMMGYLLYSGNPLQVAFMFVGGGSNGKGTLLRVVENFLGRENCSFQSLDSLNTNRFSPANLFAKVANLAGDIDATYQQSTAKFKMLTGEDEFSAERKHMNPFDFKAWGVSVFSANKIPGSADTSYGYLRRWVILKFDKKITQPILNLSEKLTAELPGIVARAVKEIAPLLEAEKFSITGEAIAGQSEFATAIDQVRQWMEECCILAPDVLNPLERQKVYDSYRMWAGRTGTNPVSAREFYGRLDAMGFKRAKRNSGRQYIDGFRVTEHNVVDAAFETIIQGME